MASIKKIKERKYKITVSNGYRPDGRKISRASTSAEKVYRNLKESGFALTPQ